MVQISNGNKIVHVIQREDINGRQKFFDFYSSCWIDDFRDAACHFTSSAQAGSVMTHAANTLAMPERLTVEQKYIR